MRKLAVLWLCSALVIAVWPVGAADVPASLSGVYRVSGTNPDGRTYTAVLEVAEYEAVYMARWLQGDGSEIHGQFILDKDVASFVTEFGNWGHYRWSGKGWDGTWGLWGAPVVGSETLTPATQSVEQLQRELEQAKVAL